MELLKKWTQISLIKRILVGMLLGIILGVALPQFTVIGILGTLFVNALKALAPMLVFFIVIHALAQRQKGGSTNMGSVIVLYLVGTFLAALCAVVASFLFPSTLLLPEAEAGTAAPGGIGEVLSSLLSNAVSNPISALANANFIGILLWAVVFGLAMSHASEPTKKVLSDLAECLSTAIRWVINCAPFGIMGLVYTTVSTTGFKAFASYAHLILVLVGCMFFIALVLNPIIVFLCVRKNPYPLVLRCLRESGVMAFFTRSSAANIPVNMAL